MIADILHLGNSLTRETSCGVDYYSSLTVDHLAGAVNKLRLRRFELCYECWQPQIMALADCLGPEPVEVIDASQPL